MVQPRHLQPYNAEGMDASNHITCMVLETGLHSKTVLLRDPESPLNVIQTRTKKIVPHFFFNSCQNTFLWTLKTCDLKELSTDHLDPSLTGKIILKATWKRNFIFIMHYQSGFYKVSFKGTGKVLHKRNRTFKLLQALQRWQMAKKKKKAKQTMEKKEDIYQDWLKS